MNRLFPLGPVAALAILASPVSFAHGDDPHVPMARPSVAAAAVETDFGRQGDPAKVTRTIRVDMSDAMRFSPDLLEVRRGETVRLDVANKGQVLHELVLGTPKDIRKHWLAMKSRAPMQHGEPRMVHVEAGRRGEVVWQFDKPGEFQFACLLPGHFEAGMVGKVVVR